MWPGSRHRHGFALHINGAGCIATMQGGGRLFLHALWGCQRPGEYAIKGRLIHATQPLFVFRAACDYFGVISRRKRSFDRWDHGLRAAAPTQLSLICEVEFYR
jgi:hypothetical protein